MPVTWTKATVTRTNPFDGTEETVIEVSAVAACGTLTRERYVFPQGTTDGEINAKVISDLAAKGYATT